MNLKTKKLIAALLIATSAGLFTAGCGTDQSAKKAPPKTADVTWTESLDGKKVDMKVTAPPKRAVSMSFATTEMMLTLGLQDQMAGTAFKEEEIYGPLADAYAKVPVLAEKWPSYEKLMSVNPDFLTGWEVPFTKRAIPAEKLIAAGIPIFVPDSMQDTKATLDTNFDDMLEYGKIFGKEDNAKKWVDGQKKKLEAVQSKLKNLPKVKADSGEINRIFTNIISNAMKYNKDNGSITATVKKSGNYIVCSIKDTGIGMRPQDKEKLFQEFYRIKNDKTRNIPGTGLGLSIVKRIVESYAGKIEVNSEYGVGSEFIVYLPYKK